jgi:hypothetical protein
VAATGNFYGQALAKALNKEIDFDTDSIKAMLTTSTYTPNLATHAYKSDVTNEVTGTGYTATGNVLTAVTLTYVAANSWGVSRANTTAYAAGDVVRPATGNGFLYQAITGGTSGGSIPTYPTTIGGTVADGTVTWMCVATGAVVLDAADPAWPTSTITARRLVIYDSTPATDATRPLIALVDFGADVSSTAATFTVVFDVRGICYVLVP